MFEGFVEEVSGGVFVSRKLSLVLDKRRKKGLIVLVMVKLKRLGIEL